MANEPTRTKSDPRYAQVNVMSAKRTHFCQTSAWMWLKENQPEIADKIRAEGYRRFPKLEPRTKAINHIDYGFLKGIKIEEER